MPNVCSKDSVSLISAIANVTVGAGGLLQYLPLGQVNEYISQYVPRLNARQFAMVSIGQALTVKVGNK